MEQDAGKKVLTSQQAMPVIGSVTMERIGQHSIGFVRVVGNEDDAVVLGSGTLITAAGRYAILTADHVLQVLPTSGAMSFVIMREGWTHRHRLQLDAAALERRTVGKASHTANGPDIGFLILPPKDAAVLGAIQTYYNLEKRRERLLSQPLTEENWSLFGLLEERTVEGPPERGFSRIKGFYGHVGFGAKPIERKSGEWDYLDFIALYNAHYDGPESFQGTSGGGLWQVEYREVAGKIEVTEALLSGVAYFESAKVGEVRTIHCHGRRSIYDQVYRAMQ